LLIWAVPIPTTCAVVNPLILAELMTTKSAVSMAAICAVVIDASCLVVKVLTCVVPKATT